MPGFPGRFGAVVTAMVTPFREDGSLNLEAAVSLAKYLAAHGSEGLVVAGSTGESTSLEDHEKLELFDAVAQAVEIPVLAGVGTASTAHTVSLIEKANALPIAGYLIVTPYYCRPSQEGLKEHFSLCASAAGDKPVMLYDIPVRTGRRISRETLLWLIERHDNIVALKDAAQDLPGVAALIAETSGRLEVYAGDDSFTFAVVALGGCGVVSVASHWAGEELKEMAYAIEAGDLRRARELNKKLQPSFVFETSEANPNPLPTKAIMNVLGLEVGQCRPPLGSFGPELEKRAREVLEGLGRL